MADFEIDRTSPAYLLGKAQADLENQREASAKLIEQMLGHEPRGIYGRPDVRIALALAARAVRRGRHLTENEQLENLAKGFEEDDPKWANEFRRKVGIPSDVGSPLTPSQK